MLLSLAAAVAATLIPIPPAGLPPPPVEAPSGPPGRAPLTLAPSPQTAPSPAPAPAIWYGAPALLADGFALTLAASGAGANNEGLFFLGGIGYFLAAPINHIVNQHPGVAAGSFFLRALASGLAVAVFIADFASQHCDGDPTVGHPCQPGRGLFLGGLVLAGAAIADDVLLARHRPPSAPAKVSWAPGLVIAPNLGMLSLGGSF